MLIVSQKDVRGSVQKHGQERLAMLQKVAIVKYAQEAVHFETSEVHLEQRCVV